MAWSTVQRARRGAQSLCCELLLKAEGHLRNPERGGARQERGFLGPCAANSFFPFGRKKSCFPRNFACWQTRGVLIPFGGELVGSLGDMPVGTPVLRLAGETPHYPIVLSFPRHRHRERGGGPKHCGHICLCFFPLSSFYSLFTFQIDP